MPRRYMLRGGPGRGRFVVHWGPAPEPLSYPVTGFDLPPGFPTLDWNKETYVLVRRVWDRTGVPETFYVHLPSVRAHDARMRKRDIEIIHTHLHPWMHGVYLPGTPLPHVAIDEEDIPWPI